MRKSLIRSACRKASAKPPLHPRFPVFITSSLFAHAKIPYPLSVQEGLRQTPAAPAASVLYKPHGGEFLSFAFHNLRQHLVKALIQKSQAGVGGGIRRAEERAQARTSRQDVGERPERARDWQVRAVRQAAARDEGTAEAAGRGDC